MIAAIAPTAPPDEEHDMEAGLVEHALDVLRTVGLTLSEFVELEERPEQFGGTENQGWHIVIRALLRQHWSEITETLVPPFEFHGDQQIIYRASQEFQMMVSNLLSNERLNGSLTVDVTRADVDAALWRWLEKAIQRIMEDTPWYTGMPSSNFHYLYEECMRDVRNARRREEQAKNEPDTGDRFAADGAAPPA